MNWEDEPGRFYEPTPQEFMLDAEDLANNSNEQTPVLICIDCSFSMRQNHRLEKVLEGLESFRQDILKDSVARDSMELCIVSYQGTMAREVMPFRSAEKMVLPKLQADGGTPLTDAVRLALELLRRRKEFYQDCGTSYYRPWLILIGDGDDTGSPYELAKVARQLKAESDAKHLQVLCITVGDETRIKYASLMRLAPDGQVHYLRDLKFREFFSWLSKSIEKTSQSLSGEEAVLAPTTSWGEIKTS